MTRLVRVPRERVARARAAIHARWQRELRRARHRTVLLIVALAVAVACLVAVAVRWIERGAP